jgi:hypothetical protein
MTEARLDLTSELHSGIWSHLLPGDSRGDEDEQVAFGFARTTCDGEQCSFQLTDWIAMGPLDFASQSNYHVELTDEARARSIKRAHDLNASLLEFHSHPFQEHAEFSGSDILGFEEFVPHVWWRLKGKPYLAIVVARRSFDGVAWISGPNNPISVQEVTAGEMILRPTGLTLKRRFSSDGQRSL